MRKLYIAEVATIIVSIMIVFIGYDRGWSKELTSIITTYTATISMLFIIAFGTTTSTSRASTSMIAVLVAAIPTIFISPGNNMTLIVVGVIITVATIVLSVISARETFHGKYQQTFLSLAVQGTTVWAILFYGPGIFQKVLG